VVAGCSVTVTTRYTHHLGLAIAPPLALGSFQRPVSGAEVHALALDFVGVAVARSVSHADDEVEDRVGREAGCGKGWWRRGVRSPQPPTGPGSWRQPGRRGEAFDTILSALRRWRPLSPLHLAPMGLLYDRQLGPIVRGRSAQVLQTARGGPAPAHTG
jgi:hypothetical protein